MDTATLADLVVLDIVLELVVLAALLRQYWRTRRVGDLWPAVVLVGWPALLFDVIQTAERVVVKWMAPRVEVTTDDLLRIFIACERVIGAGAPSVALWSLCRTKPGCCAGPPSAAPLR